MSLAIITSGPYSTIQDRGRIGYQHLGVPTSGASDSEALLLGNHLLGNQRDDAGIEICFGGFLAKATIPLNCCLTGSVQAIIRRHHIDGTMTDHPAGTVIALGAGETIEVPFFSDSLSALLLIGGGIMTAPIYGSRSTTVNAALGGLEGRLLQAGDELPIGRSPRPIAHQLDRQAYDALFAKPQNIRIMLGPQDFWFTNDALQSLCAAPYQVSAQTSRMGMRLQGAHLAHKGPADIISDGMVRGAIQVPAEGQPIIAMADHGTMGGYVKIACVIAADLAPLGRLRPHDHVQFEIVTEHEAQAAYRSRQNRLAALMS